MKVERKSSAIKNGATYKKKNKLGVFPPRDFQESGARNVALSVFKAMRDSSPCGPKPSGLRPPKGFGPQAGDELSPAAPPKITFIHSGGLQANGYSSE
jgi:hypothetical protein